MGPIWHSNWLASAEPIFRHGQHFTSWLGLAPHNKISGGKVLSSRTRRSGNRAASLLRLAAVTVGRTDTALGAFYRRLSARVGKAVTATARKIAVLFYNALRHGMDYADPGASYYEERYQQRVLANLQRRAKSLGYVLQQADTAPAAVGVSWEVASLLGIPLATPDSDEEL
jgi:transposase